MATVKFFRKLNTALTANDLVGMNTDSFYVTTYNQHPYLFYNQESISTSPSLKYPINANDSDGMGQDYTLDLPFPQVYGEGTQFLVRFNNNSLTTTPTLDSIPIRRRIKGTNTVAAGPSSNWLNSGTGYVLTYTAVGNQDYWIVEGADQPIWSDIYSKPNVAVINTSTSNTTPPTTLTSGQLYIIYDN